MAEMYKIRTKNKNVFLRVAKGHFATMHIHTAVQRVLSCS